MHTTDNQGTAEHGLLPRLRRDVRVLVRIVRMLVSYVFIGGRVRRAVRRCAAAGTRYYVDDRVVRRP